MSLHSIKERFAFKQNVVNYGILHGSKIKITYAYGTVPCIGLEKSINPFSLKSVKRLGASLGTPLGPPTKRPVTKRPVTKRPFTKRPVTKGPDYQTSRLLNVQIIKRPVTKGPDYQTSSLPNVQLPNIQLQDVHTRNYLLRFAFTCWTKSEFNTVHIF